MIDRMFSGLSGPQRLLALLAVLLASTALLAFVTGGLVVMVAAMLGLNLLLWITLSQERPRQHPPSPARRTMARPQQSLKPFSEAGSVCHLARDRPRRPR
jgi:hypothetical protein